MDMNEFGKAVIEELAKQFPEDTITFLGIEKEDDSDQLNIDFEADVTLVLPDRQWTCDKRDEPEYSRADDENLGTDQITYVDIEQGTAEKYSRGLEQCKNELDKLLPNSEFSIDIADYDSYDIEDSEVDSYDLVDDGIGWNEFWGDWSYDSYEYWEVTGPVTVEAKKVSGYIYAMPKKV